VTIPRPFAVGKFEVTRAEFAMFVRECVSARGSDADRRGKYLI
jgi:formylglycine-generating enzyme required for sulfatase activity